MTPGVNSLRRMAAGLAARAGGHPLIAVEGRVVRVTTQAVEVAGLSAFLRVGSLVTLQAGDRPALAEVVRLDRQVAVAKPLADDAAVSLGASARPGGVFSICPEPDWKGRLVNALGVAIDGGPPLAKGARAMPVLAPPPAAVGRRRVASGLTTGVAAIDLFTPLCFGQRIGIFAGSGVGKSTLLAMLARAPGFDTVVVGLVGERGREVREFIADALGDLVSSSVVVVSTGDESPMLRRLAPRTAMTVAEYFRDRGDAVLLVVDSVTRYAHACRDVALAAGEPPVARGYPPSVFSDLPQLLERAGPGSETGGSITAAFAVLVDGDDHNDPVADAIRGTLDGHIVLDRAIAESGRYPAIDVLASISRLADRVWTAERRAAVAELRRLVARYEESRDLVAVGAYRAGGDETLDRAMALVPRLYAALTQTPGQKPSETLATMLAALERSQAA